MTHTAHPRHRHGAGCRLPALRLPPRRRPRARGFVRNDSAGVLIDVEGDPAGIAELCRACSTSRRRSPASPRWSTASADAPRSTATASGSWTATARGAADVPVSIDTATCDDCLAEVADPADRRFRYPFTNCTNCGPRYTIVPAVPYDRPATTMAGFTMCPACQAEYDDPADRRFHAQPNACPVCGPRPWRGDSRTARWWPPATRRARRRRRRPARRCGSWPSRASAATTSPSTPPTPSAVAELRRRKAPRRQAVRGAWWPTSTAAAALCDARRRRGRRARLAAPPDRAGAAAGPAPPWPPASRPACPSSACCCPTARSTTCCSPASAGPLVMTSGNLSDEPIAHTDDDAVDRLGPLVDGLLTHDRPIHIRCDDSVVRAATRPAAAGPAPLPGLRARADARCPSPPAAPVLAVGAELKSTIAVAKGDDGRGQPPHRRPRAPGHLPLVPAGRRPPAPTSTASTPEVVAHDLHPEYLSTKFAVDLDLPTRRRAAPPRPRRRRAWSSTAAPAPVLGLAFDGLGYGPDGTLWGGELLVADLAGCERVGHLRPDADAGRGGRHPRAVAHGGGVGGGGRRPDRRPRRPAALAAPSSTWPSGGHGADRRPAWGGCSTPSPRSSAARRRVTLRGPGRHRARGAGPHGGPGRRRPTTTPASVADDAGLRARPVAARRRARRTTATPGSTAAVLAAGFHEAIGRAAAALAAARSPASRASTPSPSPAACSRTPGSPRSSRTSSPPPGSRCWCTAGAAQRRRHQHRPGRHRRRTTAKLVTGEPNSVA